MKNGRRVKESYGVLATRNPMKLFEIVGVKMSRIEARQ
jgi:hypothetical protein